MKLTHSRVALMVAAGFAAGCVVSQGSWILPAVAQGTGDTYALLNLFSNVMERVKTDYVEPVTGRTLIDNALNGMLTGLDPHSSYLTEAQWHDMQTQTSGKFGGIGLEVTESNGLVRVVSPIDGTPAAAAGIKPGDLITAVDGKSFVGLSLSDAVAKLRGPPDTKLSVVIKRQDVADPIVVSLVRRIIHVETVKSRLIGDVGVIRISQFTEQTDPGVHAAMKSLQAEVAKAQPNGQLRGLILDLRNDPGGLLGQAISVSNDFLDRGGIVSTRGRHSEDSESWSAKPGRDISGNLPIVVLTNNGTASAAEIVAGALQDDRRALVLGTQTFGKGSVQTLFPLPGNGAIRLTTARYYTPSGRSIQGLGVTPNVQVEDSNKPAPHFAPEHEADLNHILSNTGDDKGAPPPPPVDLPAVAQRIPKLPPADWPVLDPTKPGTDFQLQQGIVLLKGMMTGTEAAAR